MSIVATVEDEWVDQWPLADSKGRMGLTRRLASRPSEGILVVMNRNQGYMNAPARVALFAAREGWIRWTSNQRTGTWGIRAVERDTGYHVDAKGRMNVRALTDKLDAGTWPIRFRLARDPLNAARLVFAGIVE